MGSIFGSIMGMIGAGRAAHSVSDANIAGEHGILTATKDAQDAINNATAPYMASGVQGNAGLQQYVASDPTFKFNLNDYLNSPAMNFQMEQGTHAIQNSMSAAGIGAGTNAFQQMQNYGQNVGAQYYNQAFNQAENTFQTNQNATLSNLMALVGAGQTGVQGQAIAGQEGMQGSQIAGNYAVGAGNANAAGIMGQYNNLGGLMNGVAGLAMGIPGLGMGAGTTGGGILGSLFGGGGGFGGGGVGGVTGNAMGGGYSAGGNYIGE